MASAAVLQRLQSRATLTEGLLSQLRTQVEALRKAYVEKACLGKESKLRSENEALRQEVEVLKQRLVQAETKNGVKQVLLPTAATFQLVPKDVAKSVPAPATPAPKDDRPQQPQKVAVETKPSAKAEKTDAPPKKESKKETKPEKKTETKPAPTDGGSDKVDVSRLNMRIGRIVNVKKHPDADSLYVEEVDVGEAKTRTIVSGLVKHIPLEKMQDRVAVFLLNLKPAKMRGILSEGMIMCASTPEKVEIIEPPQGVNIGDRVVVDGYPGGPDEQLNPKKKIWEQIQPDLLINAEGIATYKGALWNVSDKGPFKVPSMTGCGIK